MAFDESHSFRDFRVSVIFYCRYTWRIMADVWLENTALKWFVCVKLCIYYIVFIIIVLICY